MSSIRASSRSGSSASPASSAARTCWAARIAASAPSSAGPGSIRRWRGSSSNRSPRARGSPRKRSGPEAAPRGRPPPRSHPGAGLFGRRRVPVPQIGLRLRVVERDRLDLAGDDLVDAPGRDRMAELRVAHVEAEPQDLAGHVAELGPVAGGHALHLDAHDAVHHVAELVVEHLLARRADPPVDTRPALELRALGIERAVAAFGEAGRAHELALPAPDLRAELGERVLLRPDRHLVRVEARL